MTAALRFDPIRLPPECEVLRKQVRAFLAEEIAAGTFDRTSPIVKTPTRRIFPPGRRTRLARHDLAEEIWRPRALFPRALCVTEEMRVANAPTRRFLRRRPAERPGALKYAPEHIKMDILPRICRGEVCFAIGMSEPNSGSDLFAAKTRRRKPTAAGSSTAPRSGPHPRTSPTT